MQTCTILGKGHKIKRKKNCKLEIKSFTNVEICSIEHSQNVERSLIWHRKFGHVNLQIVHEMSKKDLFWVCQSYHSLITFVTFVKLGNK
jgi:hypothetical protein